jgi:hypothetical protein
MTFVPRTKLGDGGTYVFKNKPDLYKVMINFTRVSCNIELIFCAIFIYLSYQIYRVDSPQTVCILLIYCVSIGALCCKSEGLGFDSR